VRGGGLRSKVALSEDLIHFFDVLQLRILFFYVFRYWEWPFGTFIDGGGPLVRRILSGISKIVSRDPATIDEVRKDIGLGNGSTVLDIMLSKVVADAQRTPKSETNQLFGHTQLVSNLAVTFLAGTDTTSTTLTWMLYHLSRDEGLQSECAAEALSFDLEAASEPEIVAKLRTLRSLNIEVNRVQGPASFLIFEAAKGHTVTLCGRTIRPPEEEGPMVICTMLTYANRTREAGKRQGISDPGSFDPRRWLQPDGTVRQPHPDAFFSFGHGMRVCPGRELSNLEAIVTAAYLLRAFEIRMPKDHPEVRTATSATDGPDIPIHLLLTHRSKTQQAV